MERLKRFFTAKYMLIAAAVFIASLIAFFIGAAKYPQFELNENRLLKVIGIYVDDEQYLYIKTNMGVLAYDSNGCVGRYKVSASSNLRIAVTDDIVIISDPLSDKYIHRFTRDGTPYTPTDISTYTYPTDKFESSAYEKGNCKYRVYRVLGFSFITANGRIMYHTPFGEYIARFLVLFLLPSFVYLTSGIVFRCRDIGRRIYRERVEIWKAFIDEVFRK